MTWKFEPQMKRPPKLDKATLIVGMPGIGNVGKVTADFLIDELKAKLVYNIFSYGLPNSVFVNDEHLVELPTIELYYSKKKNIIILTGDVQPPEEESTYEFCDQVINACLPLGVAKIITLGGIGLSEVQEKPSVYCTGSDKDYIKSLVKGTSASSELFGIVGPIIGVSGVMIGMAERKKIPSACLLAETLGHPAYIGIRGAKELLKLLNKKLKLTIDLKTLDKEIEDIEIEIMAKTQELSKINGKRFEGEKETSYIG